MNLVNPVVALCFAAVILSPVDVLAQASIVENQTTVLTVDATNGSDASAGIGQPLKTLQAAVNQALANNAVGVGTNVVVNPGVYREVLNVNASSAQTAAPITIQAAQSGSVTISGSDVLTHWYQGTSNRSIYTHPWNYNFGECSVPSGWPGNIQPIVRRREMVFVNGSALTQVLSMSQMRVGTFYVNESSNVIDVWPSSGTNMSTALVEAAVRPQTLSVSGQHNIVFRNLVFQHAASCMNQNGANVNGSTNVLFDTVQVKWNNWGGLAIDSSTGITIRNSIATYNGGVGFASFHGRNALLQSVESDYNNWRGAMGGLFDWGMGGTKLMGMHNVTVTQYRAVRNQAQGLWFDTDNKNVAISNAHLIGNAVANLQLEANEGPVSITNSAMCDGALGINAINTEHITATGNTFYNNGGGKNGAQFFLAGNPGGRNITDWETHQHYFLQTANTTLTNNAFEDAGSGEVLFSTYLSGNDWNSFTSNFKGSGNRWYDSSSTNKFILSGNRQTNLSGWQNAVRSDYSSRWQSDSQAVSACQ